MFCALVSWFMFAVHYSIFVQCVFILTCHMVREEYNGGTCPWKKIVISELRVAPRRLAVSVSAFCLQPVPCASPKIEYFQFSKLLPLFPTTKVGDGGNKYSSLAPFQVIPNYLTIISKLLFALNSSIAYNLSIYTYMQQNV